MSTHRVTSADIAAIRVHLPTQGAHVVDNRAMPSVNAQHLVALMLADSTVGFASSHDAARMQDPDVLALRAKVTLVPSEELARAEPARQAIVELDLKDGRQLRHHTHAVRGTTTNPMTRDEVAAKALDLMLPTLGRERAQDVIDTVWNLERMSSLSRLATLLQASAGRRS